MKTLSEKVIETIKVNDVLIKKNFKYQDVAETVKELKNDVETFRFEQRRIGIGNGELFVELQRIIDARFGNFAEVENSEVKEKKYG